MYKLHIFILIINFYSQYLIPNTHSTSLERSYDVGQRDGCCIDVETTLCAYWGRVVIYLLGVSLGVYNNMIHSLQMKHKIFSKNNTDKIT